jgi:hypothetical protein
VGLLGLGEEEERRNWVWVCGEERVKPRCGVEAEASRAACYDDDFPFEGEDGGEILELCFCHCGLQLSFWLF